MMRQRPNTFWIAVLVLLSHLTVVMPALAQSELDCQADFFFSYLDSTTIHFYNNSAPYDSAEWTFSEGTIIRQTAYSVTLSVPSRQTYACLRVATTSGCNDTYCLDVLPGMPGDVCTITDCVWPGDANGDRRANNYDVLNIGLGFGTTGPARVYHPVPDDPIAWTPVHADNWNNWIGIVNYKHLDCDGNGQIDHNDLEAIKKNYQPDNQYFSTSIEEAPPLELRLDETVFFVNESQQSDSILLTGMLYAGSSQTPMHDLYGLAFTVRYDTDLTRPGTAQFAPVAHSFLAGDTTLIDLNANLDAQEEDRGRTDYAITRIDGQSVNGEGPVATFSLIIEGDIIGGKEFIDINVDLEKVRAIDSLGRDLPINIVNDQLKVFVVADNVTSTEDQLNTDRAFNLSPNPAGDWLWLRTNDTAWTFADIFDATGRFMQRITIQDTNQRIRLAHFPQGTYLFRAMRSDGTVQSKSFVKY